jgi:DNA-binding CsgD family transcriptional regulator
VQLLKALLPHLRTAMQIHRKLMERTQIGHAAVATLDRMSSAAFICDEDAMVLHKNARAERLASSFVHQHRLSLPSASENARLRNAIAAVAEGALNGTARDIRMRLTSVGDIPVSAVVSAIHQQDVVHLIRPLVAVLVGVHGDATDDAVGGLQELYGLTGAELRLAQALLLGQSLRLAASKLGLSYETTRTYLKRLFDKTGTRRQPDLVRTLLTSIVS